jgi:RNA-splicing ligase RtcB
MREITRRISFGLGVPAQERADHRVLEQIRNADFAPKRKLAQLAESQLGTVGSGNHYVNVMESWSTRCSRSSAPKQCTRCTTTTPSRGGRSTSVAATVASPDADASLHSTVHGAGRVMSRMRSAGRVRRRERSACSDRDCNRVFDSDTARCPDYPTARMRKVWIEERVARGVQAPA